ncbi:MAG: TetR family transcriptional regulator [Sphingomonadales bacterium]|nr:TetR family transcriptional regulator [Sphingomonadales bacterium]
MLTTATPPLTFRRVEQESGLKVGHISYHFPTKEDLVRGLLDAVMAGYSDRSDRLVTATEGGDRAQFRAAIVTILRDIQTFETTHLSRARSMANHDPVVNDSVQEFYRRARVRMIALRRLNPACPETDAERGHYTGVRSM